MATERALHKAVEAWCKPTTEHLTMQPELAEVFAELLDEIWSQAWLGNASTAELLSELQMRAEIHGYADYKTVDGEAYLSPSCGHTWEILSEQRGLDR